MPPLVKLMKQFNAAQVVARNNQNYILALKEQYEMQFASVSEVDDSTSKAEYS